jgi:hypothetical protein
MRSNYAVVTAIAAFVALSSQAEAGLALGTAGNFAVLAGSTVTNTGATLIDGGDVGVSPGTSITGFSPGSGTLAAPYVLHSGDAVAAQAERDLNVAYTAAAALTPTRALTGLDLGGLTLTPGTYFFSSSAQLTGTLTLNDLGDPNAQFVFQIGSTLTTATGSSVVTIDNNGHPSTDSNVFWQVGSSATIGTTTAFEGHLLALTSITFNTDATDLDGSALAINGAVTLDTNHIVNLSSVPEPASLALVLVGGALSGLASVRKRWRARINLQGITSPDGPSTP